MPGILKQLTLLFLLVHPVLVSAQQVDRPLRLELGDAVVTGFSGTIAPDRTQAVSAGRAAADLTFINPDGASARVVSTGRPGFVWDGRLFPAPKTFDVFAKDVGQVFGVALDDQTPPNIYVASTSAYGLHIVARGRDGRPERRKKGGPGVGWMRGQFGLDLQGGPGSVYKVDGRTGQVSLLANVTLEGVPNPGPGLGNLAYDSAHKQLLMSDLYTGMIHRFDLEGRELGAPYDHGVAGLTAAGQLSQPFNPRNRPNIASDRFDAENPTTWGFAPPARRVWALALHEGRLYYSARNGSANEPPQIWSVGVARDGSFAADPRWELDVPAQPGPYPVSDIAFSQRGAMILAQRATAAGNYDYSAFTRAGEPRVLRFWLKGPGDPPSPGRWKPTPEEYAVGFAGSYRNANGGIALGYGYKPDGTLDTATCESSLWVTGQNLRNNQALRGQLEPGGPLVVHGLTAIPASPVRPLNEPPWASYVVDYNETFVDPRAAGHLGGVRINSKPCAPPAVYGGPGYPANPPYTVGPPTVIVSTDCVSRGDCPPPPPRPDLEIRKIGEVNLNNPHGGYFTIGVTNLSVPLTGPQIITVTDVVPAGMTFTGVTSTNWTCPVVPPVIPSGGTLTCTYSGPFPVAANQLLGTIDIVATGGDGPYENCATLSAPSDSNPLNDKACVTVQKPKYGELIVRKSVVYNGALIMPSLTYPVTVTCGSNVTTLNLVDNVPQSIGNIPYNTSCSIVEPPPPVPPGACEPNKTGVWTTTMVPPASPPSSVTISSVTTTVVITNTLDCVLKEQQLTSLRVTKEVVNETDPQVPTTGITFTGNVSCASGGSPAVVTPFSLTDGSSQTISNITIGASCTVTENPPPLPSGTCRRPGDVLTWTTVPVPPVPMTSAPGSVTIRNILSCKAGDGQGGTSLTLRKQVENLTDPLIPVTGMTYSGSVSCVSGGSPPVVTPFNLSDGGSMIVNVAIGATCTVTENPPGPPSGSCRKEGDVPTWTTDVPGPVLLGSSPQTVKVVNTLQCKPGSGGNGYFRVTKTINKPQSVSTTGLTFPATITCGGNTSTTTLAVASPHVVTGIPVGTNCSVTETLPPPPSGCPPRTTPVWGTPVYVPPTITIVSGMGPVINVQNTLTCEPVKNIGVVPPPPRPLACRAPMIASPSGTACVCPSGLVQRGRACARPLECVAPAKLNRTGSGCVCPEGMQLKGRSCIARGPTVTPSDVIRVVPGVFGPGGGRSDGGRGRGGGAGESRGR